MEPCTPPALFKSFTTRALALSSLLLVGCSALPEAGTEPAPCQRVALEPSPLWTAAATWNHGADRLLLVDPGSASLLVYRLSGELERRVKLDGFSKLEYSTPLRLEMTKLGYLLGDTSNLLWFDETLNLVEHRRPFEALGSQGVQEGRLSDFAEAGGALFAYADFEGQDEKWQRGFVRLALKRPGFQLLHGMPVERGGEFTSYFHYDRRPYVVHLGKEAYVLRLTTPATISRATRRGLERLHTSRLGEDFTATALHAWNGTLYLLYRVRDEVPEDASEPEAPKLLSKEARAILEAMERQGAGAHHWELQAIDPRSGRPLARYRLPATAERLRLIPGPHAWALLEEGLAPNLDAAKGGTLLTRLPSHWFRARSGDQPVDLVCL